MLFSLVACNSFPSDPITIEAAEGNVCNPKVLFEKHQQFTDDLINKAEQKATNPYKDIFAKKELWGCLVSRWDNRDQTQDDKTYFSLVKILEDGSILSLEPIEKKYTPVLRIPNDDKLQNFRFKLFVMDPNLVVPTQDKDLDKINKADPTTLSADEKQVRTNLETLRGYCRAADTEKYKCFEDGINKCLFETTLFVSAPNNEDVQKRLATPGEGKTCTSCVPEVCNGVDDDCDGFVDNVRDPKTGKTLMNDKDPVLLTRKCYNSKFENLTQEEVDQLSNSAKSKGRCKTGIQTCSNGKWSECVGSETPEKETCNNVDDDCDGKVDDDDEGKNPLCEVGFACNSGTCEFSTCPAGQNPCGEGNARECVVFSTNTSHCGGCGIKCAPGEKCNEGKCGTECVKGQTQCEVGGQNQCFDLQTDTNHCGKCNQKCPDGQRCAAGKCESSCLAGQTLCDVSGTDVCIDLTSDTNHCSKCNQKCPDGQKCVVSQCVTSCPNGQAECVVDKAPQCYDLQITNAHCGKCGNVCKSGEFCEKGVCKTGCPGTQVVCKVNKVDVCIELQDDTNHCGSCGNKCPSGQVCNAGKCQSSCLAGQNICKISGSDQCIDLQVDVNHCGKCGARCTGGKLCIGGKCQCTSGLTDCSGICVDATEDRNNCGACATKCKSGEICNSGKCDVSCPGKQKVCSGVCVDTQSDITNCGNCGVRCNGGKECVSGSCKCTGGLFDCGGVCRDRQSDLNHCGACNKKCAAGQLCSAGQCTFNCPDGQTACSGSCVDTKTDNTNCGRCGRQCTGGKNAPTASAAVPKVSPIAAGFAVTLKLT